MPEPTPLETVGTEDVRRLLRTVDEWTPPTPVVTLLHDGRRRSRLRRLRRVGPVAAAAAATVVVLAVPRLGTAPTAIPAAPSTPATSPSAPLTAAQVRSRCAPQIASLSGLPQYAADTPRDATWAPVLPGPYRVGDRVLLRVTAPVTTPSPWARWCLVPPEGHERQPVPTSTFSLRDLPAADVPSLCRQLAAPEDPGLGDPATRVLARTPPTADAGPDVALLRTREHTVVCTTTPVSWDSSYSSADVLPVSANPAAGLSWTLTGSAGKSAATPAAAWYSGAGAVPGAARVVVTVDGTDHEAVVVDGAYAVSVEERGAPRLAVPVVTAYRADGAMIGRWTAPGS